MVKKTETKIRYNTIDIDGVRYRTLLTEKYNQRKKYVEYNPKLMTAFIPGTIVDVYVKEGKKVKEGETMLILEAMKMRNQLQAPFDATIKKVLVKVNDLVSKNQLMIELE